MVGRVSFAATAVGVVLTAMGLPATANPPASTMSGEALLDMAAQNRVILVDIRLGGEKPGLPTIAGVESLGLPWPNQTYDQATNEPHVHFYRTIRQLQRQHPGTPIVLVCGIGVRSRQAVARAKDFGIGGISHLEGGLHGNERDPGLLVAIAMR